MAGPPEAVISHTETLATVKPGYTKKEEIARQIRNKIDPDKLFVIEDIVRVLPSGKCDFLDAKRFKRGKKR